MIQSQSRENTVWYAAGQLNFPEKEAGKLTVHPSIQISDFVVNFSPCRTSGGVTFIAPVYFPTVKERWAKSLIISLADWWREK
jgi:hypothetical protein